MAGKDREELACLLYEAVLYSFGLVLAKYDAFSSEVMIRDIGRSIREYLRDRGFELEEGSDPKEAIHNILRVFVDRGFVDGLEVEEVDGKLRIRWKNLLGIEAYGRLFRETRSPFLSCPLNALMLSALERYGFTLATSECRFDLEEGSVETLEEIRPLRPPEGDLNPLVLENARLYELARERAMELERRNRELRTLYAVTKTMSGVEDLDKVFSRSLEKIVRFTGADGGNILLVEDGVFKLKSHVGLSEEFFESFRELSLDEGTSGMVLRTGKSVTVGVEDYPTERFLEVLQREGVRSIASAPLTSRGKVLGVIHLVSRRPRFFEEGVLSFLESIGEAVGVVVENATLLSRVMERERRLRDFYESARDAVFEVDAGGYFTFMNQAGAEMAGLSSPEEVIGRHATEFWADPGDREAYLKELLEKGYVRQYPVRARRADGELAYWELTSSVIRDEDGNFAGIMGICRDVTERRRLEKELKGLMEELQRKVEERTRELEESREAILNVAEDLEASNRELRRALRELKSLDELKGNIIANVSHELRTPITICRGALEVALQEKDPANQRRLINMAMDALERQNRIVGDLIAVSQIDKSRFILNLQKIDIPTLVSHTVEGFRKAAERAGVRLETRLTGDLPPAVADYERIRHVLGNLLDNAVKFNRRGGSVVVEASSSGGMLRVCVSDTGIGIPGEDLDRVFDRLYQVDSSLTRRYGGTGMGLSIVREIVMAHSGRVSVESQLGKGSRFCFTIPVARETDPEERR
jgi:PAS domain S-box-containing protein